MIDRVVTDLVDATAARIAALDPASIEDVRANDRPLVAFSEDVFEEHASLKKFLGANLYRHPQVRKMNDQTKAMLEVLFERYMNEPAQMAAEFEAAALAEPGDDAQRARAVADYIAGMTDRFAIAEHERLTG